jgi:hypothetical protein
VLEHKLSHGLLEHAQPRLDGGRTLGRVAQVARDAAYVCFCSWR